MKCFVIIAIAALALTVSADTPGHCLFEQILGTWEMQVTAQDFDSTVVCNMPEMDVAETYRFKLISPNVAEGEDGATGTFTIVYDEEIEVIIGGRRFWWQFEWESMEHPVGIQSSCDLVHSTGGYIHEDQDPAVLPTQWGCFSGSLVDPTYPELDSRHFQPDVKVVRAADIPQSVMVEAINEANLGWKAKEYPEELMHTIKTAVSRQGPLNSIKLPAHRLVDNSLPDGAPDQFDWCDVDGDSYCSPIRNQGSCGSCWAFGVTAALNDRVRVKSGNADQTIYSPEDLVACSAFAEGCEGGWGYNAGKQVADFGIVPEECFPYESGSGPTPECSKKCDDSDKLIIHEYQYVGGYYGACTVNAMIENLLEHGSLTTSIMVLPDFFNWDPNEGPYRHDEQADKKLKEVLSAKLGVNDIHWEEANHLVTITGYGVTDDGTPYWQVKNSWGTSWGDSGFFQIVRGIGQVAFEHMAINFTI